MPGSLSIEKEAGLWSKSNLDSCLLMVCVGALSGIAVACLRTPLHLPGHKALFWMVPVITARLSTRARSGASIGALATVVCTVGLGGRLAGGPTMMPLVVAAGVVIDVAVVYLENHNARFFRRLWIMAVAAAIGNLICFAKRTFEPMGGYFSSGNVTDMLTVAAYHAFFGLLSGMSGSVLIRAYQYMLGSIHAWTRKTPLLSQGVGGGFGVVARPSAGVSQVRMGHFVGDEPSGE